MNSQNPSECPTFWILFGFLLDLVVVFLGGTFWNALAHGYVPISCDNFRGQGSSCHRIVVTIPWPGELAA